MKNLNFFRLMRFLSVGLIVFPGLLLSESKIFAGGPLVLSNAGNILVWPNASQIPFRMDRGTLGALNQTQAQQLVVDSFDVWKNVATSSVDFVNQGNLPVDVTASNYTTYLSKPNDGISPIIFDSDGSIIDAVFGAGASENILGFAAPYSTSSGIVEGESVLNGRFVPNASDLGIFKATMVHEFGHYVGLDHSQINNFAANNGVTADDIYLPTMFPTATDNDAPIAELNPDDVAWISELYPSGGSTLGAIEGAIFNSAGSAFDGANVTARGAANPLFQAVSCVSSYRYPAARGLYRIPKLPVGRYTVGIDQIDGTFTGGSSVGPFDTPRALPGPVDYYNGASESASSSSDKPENSLSLAVNAGSKVSGIDICINNGYPTPSKNITEHEPNNDDQEAQILKGTRLVSGSAANTDAGAFELSAGDDIEDLYFLDVGSAASIHVTLTPSDTTKDVDLIGFFPGGIIFARETNAPASNNGSEVFGPIEIPSEGAFIGISYFDLQGAGSTNYTINIQVVQHPIGIDSISPINLAAGESNQIVLINGSGFSSGSTVAFPGSGITVHSTRFVNENQLEATLSIASDATAGLKNISVKSSENQLGRLENAFQVKPLTRVEGWHLFE